MRSEKFLNDVVPRCRVIVVIHTVAGMGLDIHFEVVFRDVGEIVDNSGGNRCQGRVPGCEAVSAAIG
jgi:hypothetical protein